MSFGKWVNVQPLYVWGLFQPTLFLLSFGDSDHINIISFILVSQDPESLFMFFLFSVYSLCCLNLVNSSEKFSNLLILSSINSTQLSRYLVSFYVTLFFCSIIFILFFFITSISLMRFSFLICSTIIHNQLLNIFMTALKYLSNNSNIWFILANCFFSFKL